MQNDKPHHTRKEEKSSWRKELATPFKNCSSRRRVGKSEQEREHTPSQLPRISPGPSILPVSGWWERTTRSILFSIQVQCLSSHTHTHRQCVCGLYTYLLNDTSIQYIYTHPMLRRYLSRRFQQRWQLFLSFVCLYIRVRKRARNEIEIERRLQMSWHPHCVCVENENEMRKGISAKSGLFVRNRM